MPRSLRPCLFALAVLLLAGCGTDPSPGDAPPRRTLDPQTEAVRFFGANTRAVVLVRSDMPRPLAELGDLADGYPGVVDAVTGTRGILDTAGVDSESLLRLGRDEDGNGPGSELAAGLAPGPGGPHLVVVMPTDRPQDLDGLLADAVADGRLRPAGEYDDAHLYRTDGAAVAVRDGVLVVSGSVAEVRRALATRDGDAERRIDDGRIAGALEDVPTRAPLHIVARRGDQFAALAVRPEDDGAEIRVSANLPEGQEGEDAGPHRVTVSAADLADLLREEAGLPVGAATGLAAIAPLRGASYADGDRFIATFTVEPE
jgi:hypothetical protein